MSTGNLRVLTTASTALQTRHDAGLNTWLPAYPSPCSTTQHNSLLQMRCLHVITPIARTVAIFCLSFVSANYCMFCYSSASYINCFLFPVVALLSLFFAQRVLTGQGISNSPKSGPDSWVRATLVTLENPVMKPTPRES